MNIPQTINFRSRLGVGPKRAWSFLGLRLRDAAKADFLMVYAEGPRHYIPGFDALHRIKSLLLAEGTPEDASVLMLGAGGGLELAMLAEAHPDWTFVGVDPARETLLEAERVLGPALERVTLVEGYTNAAPAGAFNAATCLMILHFLEAAEREATVRTIHRRLRPDAPFVAAHGSFLQADDARSRWLARYEAYTVAPGAEPEQAGKVRAAVEANLPALTPEEDVAILARGGFQDVKLFYAASKWRGWMARG